MRQPDRIRQAGDQWERQFSACYHDIEPAALESQRYKSRAAYMEELLRAGYTPTAELVMWLFDHDDTESLYAIAKSGGGHDLIRHALAANC